MSTILENAERLGRLLESYTFDVNADAKAFVHDFEQFVFGVVCAAEEDLKLARWNLREITPQVLDLVPDALSGETLVQASRHQSFDEMAPSAGAPQSEAVSEFLSLSLMVARAEKLLAEWQPLEHHFRYRGGIGRRNLERAFMRWLDIDETMKARFEQSEIGLHAVPFG